MSVVPVRSSASNKSEQLTQLLFGEMVEIVEKKGRQWTKVRCIWDNCIGWVLTQQLSPLTDKEVQHFKQNFAYCLDLFQPLLLDEHSMPVVIGSSLPDFDGIKFVFDNHIYRYSGQAVFPEHILPTAENILKIARRYLMSPYQWGGRSPLGIDAPGLVQMVFKLVGVNLQRTAEKQVYQGELIDFNEQARPGDLAFFENKSGNISHVGIVMPEGKIIHAAQHVRIDMLDHYGIFNLPENKYTHRLRVIKRHLSFDDSNQLGEAVELSSQKQGALF